MQIKTIAKAIKTLGQGVAVGITDAHAERDPIELFSEWFAAADTSGLVHPEAMTLATASSDGAPSARIVLLKEVCDDGFVFYTNFSSRKSRQLDENPRVALVLHWAVLERQIRIEGLVEKVSRERATAYFHSRPRGSQIGAWASRQSEVLSERTILEERVRHFEERFEGGPVELPDFWGGWLVRPQRIEFWQGRASRLHDRLVFTGSVGAWSTERLYP